MELEAFRAMIVDRLVSDFEIGRRYVELLQEAGTWNFLHRHDTIKSKNPLEFMQNGDALEFIKTHRRELYSRLTGKESAA